MTALVAQAEAFDTGLGYAVAGWIVVGAGLGGFVAWTVVSGRRLAAKVPPARRRWSNPEDAA